MPVDSAIPLTKVPPGNSSRVVDIMGRGAFRRRLLDMGFIPGAFVRVIKGAPLGNPIEYCVGGTHVTLRKQEAAHILVERVPLPPWCDKYPPHHRARGRRGKGLRWRRRSPSR
jgi:ferrous iron transport protein A